METKLAVEKIRAIAKLGPPLASSTPHRALIGGTGAMDFGEWAGRVWAEVGAPKSGGKKLFFALDFFLPLEARGEYRKKTAHPLAVSQRQLPARSGSKHQTATMPLFILTETSAG